MYSAMSTIAALRDRCSPLPRGTTVPALCFLFPEEDTLRRFSQEIQASEKLVYRTFLWLFGGGTTQFAVPGAETHITHDNSRH